MGEKLKKVIGASGSNSIERKASVAPPGEIKADSAKPRSSSSTSQLLLEAAVTEFNQHGYDGTDTNRIARKAGFAPQTFYRWYEDKSDIFIAVYRRWQSIDLQSISSLLQVNAPDEALVDACITHFLAYRMFRRSLRHLAYENSRIREARTAYRLGLIAFAQNWNPDLKDASFVATSLLQIERLADAIVEDEFLDMSLPGTSARALLASIFRVLRGSRQKT